MTLTRRNALKGIGATLFGLAAACSGIERKPNQPHYEQTVKTPTGNKRIKIMFSFGAHATKSDAKEVSDAISEFKPHVYCPENADVFESDAASQEAAHLHKINPYNEYKKIVGENTGAFFPEFAENESDAQMKVPYLYYLERMSDAEYRTKYPYEPYWHKIVLSNNLFIPAGLFLVGNAEESHEKFKRVFAEFTQNQHAREKRINSHLENLCSVLLKKYDDLAKEDEIRVLVRYGATHTPLYFRSQKYGFGQISRRIKPITFNLYDAAIRKVTALGKSLTEQDILQANLAATVEQCANDHFHAGKSGPLSISSNFNALVNNQLRKVKDYATFERISQNTAKQSNNLPDYEKLRNAFALEKLYLPTTLAEIPRELKRRGIRPVV